MSRFTTAINLLDAVTADTTGQYVDISMRTMKSIQFVASGISGGNGVFKVYVSNDGVNFVQYNRLTSNVTNTNTQNDTRVDSVTLSSNTNVIYFIPHDDHFRYIRCDVDVTTNGTYTAILSALD